MPFQLWMVISISFEWERGKESFKYCSVQQQDTDAWDIILWIECPCNSIFREHEKNVRRNLVTPENSVSISNRQNRRFINSFLLCSECTYQNNFFQRKRKKYVLPNPAINEKHSIIYSLKESILDLYNNRGKGSSALHRVLKLHRVAFCASSSHKCRYARVYSEERQVLPNDGVIFPCFQIHLW